MDTSVSVTFRAYESLRDDNLIREKYATPDDVLDHLTGKEDFKSLSDNIKEVMIKSGLCSDKSTRNDFIDILYDRFHQLETEIPDTMPDLSGVSIYNENHVKGIYKKTNIARETVKRWIDGSTQKTNDYNVLLKICFALELELPATTEFLNKNGFNGFNIRNPLDAIFIYCSLNKRPYVTALELFLKYLSAPVTMKKDIDSERPYDSHDTTQQLEDSILKNSDWESDEKFLSTFLIPHKQMFTEYSKTAYAEYEKVKNPFYLTAVKIYLEKEAEAVSRKYRNDYKRKAYKRKYGELLPAEVKKSEIKITGKMKRALLHHEWNNEFIKKMAGSVKIGIESNSTGHTTVNNNLSSLLDELGAYMKENRNNAKIQFEISQFLSYIMSGDDCLFEMLPAVIGDNMRKKSFKNSDLSETVLYLFPHRQTMAEYESRPASVGNGVYTRKALILMYYFAFAYEFSAKKPGTTYFADILSEYDFSTFIEEVNAVLTHCRFAPLYPGNRFDWLILRSVRQFEIYDPYEDLTDCISFFNDVLEASFHGL